jgi:MbtH protein
MHEIIEVIKMDTPTQPSDEIYIVLINSEEQYSLWSSLNPEPKGWKQVFTGSKEDCLSYIKKNWKDMRPKSLRDRIARQL